MVLFLFIIMLLDLRAEERRKINLAAYAGGGLVTLAFVAELWLVLQKFDAGKTAFPAAVARQHVDDVRNVGTALFATHNLPFQVIGVAYPGGHHRRGGPLQAGTEVTATMSLSLTLNHYLLVSGLLFAIGFAGVMLRRNIIIIFMSLELMLNAANLSLVAFSRFNLTVGRPAELQRAGPGLLHHHCRRRGSGRGPRDHRRALPRAADDARRGHQLAQVLARAPMNDDAHFPWFILLAPLVSAVIIQLFTRRIAWP